MGFKLPTHNTFLYLITVLTFVYHSKFCDMFFIISLLELLNLHFAVQTHVQTESDVSYDFLFIAIAHITYSDKVKRDT